MRLLGLPLALFASLPAAAQVAGVADSTCPNNGLRADGTDWWHVDGNLPNELNALQDPPGEMSLTHSELSNEITFTQAHAPDVAVEPFATAAWVVHTSETNHNTFVRRVDLATGASSVITGVGLRSALPPRVVFHSDINAAVIAIAEANGPDPGNGPPWRFRKAVFNAGTNDITITPLDFGFLDDDLESTRRIIASDFDLDCRDVGVDSCVLVALMHDDTVDTRDPGRLASIKFTISAGGSVTLTPANDWAFETTNRNINSVIGVALTDDRLAISQGKRQSTSALTTAFYEWNGTSVTVALSLAQNHNGDAESCAAPSPRGVTMGASTAHGGYSIAWCPTCGAAGRIESLHFGKQENGSDFCF